MAIECLMSGKFDLGTKFLTFLKFKFKYSMWLVATILVSASLERGRVGGLTFL